MAVGNMVNAELQGVKTREALTDDCLNIFFRSRAVRVALECASGTKREGKRFVVFAEVIVDFARQKCSGVVSSLREVIALVQRLAVVGNDALVTVNEGVHNDIHKGNVL